MKNLFLFFLSLFLFIAAPVFDTAAEVNVSISVPAPPPLVFPAPPDVVVVPSGNTYVYMVPNMTGVYFYRGHWYRHHHGHWYRSAAYDGIWVFLEPKFVPRVIVRVPPEYPRYLPHDYHRIHHNDLHGHWRAWDRDRHWHKHNWYKHEAREEVRRERLHHIKKERAAAHHPEQRRVEKHRQQKDIHKKELKQDDRGKRGKHGERGHDESGNRGEHRDREREHR